MATATVFEGMLNMLGAPTTAVTLQALEAWAASEGTPVSWNNPLATTEPWPGAVIVNSAGVRAYPSEYTGAEATAATLRLPAYTAVVRALRQNAGLRAIFDAVNHSPWCSGCQAGQYPVALYRLAYGRGGKPPPLPPPAPAPPPQKGSGAQVNGQVATAWDHFKWEGTTGTGRAIGKISSAADTIRRARR